MDLDLKPKLAVSSREPQLLLPFLCTPDPEPESPYVVIESDPEPLSAGNEEFGQFSS